MREVASTSTHLERTRLVMRLPARRGMVRGEGRRGKAGRADGEGGGRDREGYLTDIRCM